MHSINSICALRNVVGIAAAISAPITVPSLLIFELMARRETNPHMCRREVQLITKTLQGFVAFSLAGGLGLLGACAMVSAILHYRSGQEKESGLGKLLATWVKFSNVFAAVDVTRLYLLQAAVEGRPLVRFIPPAMLIGCGGATLACLVDRSTRSPRPHIHAQPYRSAPRPTPSSQPEYVQWQTGTILETQGDELVETIVHSNGTLISQTIPPVQIPGIGQPELEHHIRQLGHIASPAEYLPGFVTPSAPEQDPDDLVWE